MKALPETLSLSTPDLDPDPDPRGNPLLHKPLRPATAPLCEVKSVFTPAQPSPAQDKRSSNWGRRGVGLMRGMGGGWVSGMRI